MSNYQIVDCTSLAGVPLGALGQLAGQSGARQLNALRQQTNGGYWMAPPYTDAPAATNTSRPMAPLNGKTFVSVNNSFSGNILISTAKPSIVFSAGVSLKGGAGGPGQAGQPAITCINSQGVVGVYLNPGCYLEGGGGGGGSGGTKQPTQSGTGVVFQAGGAGGYALTAQSGVWVYNNAAAVYKGSAGANGGAGGGAGLGGGGGGGGWPNGVGGAAGTSKATSGVTAIGSNLTSPTGLNTSGGGGSGGQKDPAASGAQPGAAGTPYQSSPGGGQAAISGGSTAVQWNGPSSPVHN